MSEVGKAGGRRDVAECWTGREQRRLIRYDFSEALQLAASGMRLGMRLTGGIALGRHHMPFAVRAPQPDCAEGGQAGRGRTCNAQPTQCVHFASATHKNRKARGLVRAGRYRGTSGTLLLGGFVSSFVLELPGPGRRFCSTNCLPVVDRTSLSRPLCCAQLESDGPGSFASRLGPCPMSPCPTPAPSARDTLGQYERRGDPYCMYVKVRHIHDNTSTLDVHSRYSKAWGRFRCQPCVTVRLESHPRGGMQEPG